MKVVLKEDVDNLGTKGALVEVADGYARNYLVPRGLALQATRGAVKQAESMRRNREAREVRERTAAEALAQQLTGTTVKVTARAGEGGKLFGSVSAADIAHAIEAQTGTAVDRRKVGLEEPLKELGTTELPVQLHSAVTAHITVEVVAE